MFKHCEKFDFLIFNRCNEELRGYVLPSVPKSGLIAERTDVILRHRLLSRRGHISRDNYVSRGVKWACGCYGGTSNANWNSASCVVCQLMHMECTV
jgi:hypothetical protein